MSDTPVSARVGSRKRPCLAQTKTISGCAWGACLGWVAALVSLWIQFRIGVYDTWDALWLPLTGLGAIGSLKVVVTNAPGLFRRGT